MWQKDSRLSREGKVLAFTQSFGKRPEEERNYVDSKMVQGDAIDLTRDDVVEQCLAIYEAYYGKSKVERSAEAWRLFRDVKKKAGESLVEYVQRFGAIISKMKNSEDDGRYMVHARILAIILVDGSGLSTIEKSNILSRVDQDDDRIFDSVVDSMRKTSGVLTTERSGVERDT